ncbi:MAG: twin-arginine translocase TatA/TatE family subunit [Rickettsiales bacterium]|nr:twin-arginine translocase TatA/TatE family subunit [Rickettsiales bacterium]|tara:strand:+ start:200 stop:430 length:231 start_codon:yes stop_codon:yes gene_type:complete
MSIGIWQLVLILVIVFVVFGAGKLPRVMGDVGKGVRSLRDGLKGDEESKKEPEKLESATPSTSVETDDSKHDKTSA